MVTIKQVKRLYNPVIDLEGILLTMYDGRLKLTEQVEAEVREHFPGQGLQNGDSAQCAPFGIAQLWDAGHLF